MELPNELTKPSHLTKRHLQLTNAINRIEAKLAEAEPDKDEYRIVYNGKLSLSSKKELSRLYRKAGWSAVEFRHDEEVEDRPITFIILHR